MANERVSWSVYFRAYLVYTSRKLSKLRTKKCTTTAHLVATKGAGNGRPISKCGIIPRVGGVQALKQGLGRVQNYATFSSSVGAHAELSIVDECGVYSGYVVRRLFVQIQATQLLSKLEFLLLEILGIQPS